MEAFNQLSKLTKTLLVAGILFLLYGSISTLAGIYFFWESDSIGWMLLFGGIIGFLLNRIRIKKAAQKKAVPEKIGVGFIAFVLLIRVIFAVVIHFSDAYTTAVNYVTTNPELRSEAGTISGVGFFITGGIETRSDSSGQHGNAQIRLTVKGDKKYKNVTVFLIKMPDRPEWVVEGIQ